MPCISQNSCSPAANNRVAKYVQLQAVLEMARRALHEEMAAGDALTSAHAVRDYLRLMLRGRPQEVFMGIFLDARNRVIASEELFHGTLTHTSVYPREVVKRAIHQTRGESSSRITTRPGWPSPASTISI